MFEIMNGTHVFEENEQEENMSAPRVSSLSLDKFIKSQKNLARPPPRLWPRDHRSIPNPRPPPETNHLQEIPTLTLDHPILRRLESCHNTRQFKEVHTHLIVTSISQFSLVTSQALKKLCALGAVSNAVSFFKTVQEPDAFLCNTVMRAYVNASDSSSALRFYYDEMMKKCIVPNHYTFPIVIKGCVAVESAQEGEKAHGKVVRSGFESDLFVKNSLIHLYCFFGNIGDGRKVFDYGFALDLVSWNSMIDGYVKNGDVLAARELFDEMPDRDMFSWNSMIFGYADSGDMEGASWFFDRTPCRDVVSWNCMIDGFAKVGNLPLARTFFNRMNSRNLVTWNSMLALYVMFKDYDECLRLFCSMVKEEMEMKIKPNEATLTSVLTACTNLGKLEEGKFVHSYIEKNQIQGDVLLWTALLTMYSKCGDLGNAKAVFDRMEDKTVVSWNAMIMGYGIHGRAKEALMMFMEMEEKGYLPNNATFTCLLSACKNAGLIFEGWWCFNRMTRVYKLEPKLEHYGCMVDLLARSGLVQDSESFIRNIPKTESSLWNALLSACRTHSDLELGEIVARRLIEMQPMDVGPYVLLSNIYAEEGNWEGVENVRMMMKEKGLQKPAGLSSAHTPTQSDSESSIHSKNMVYSMLGEIGSHIKSSYRAQ